MESDALRSGDAIDRGHPPDIRPPGCAQEDWWSGEIHLRSLRRRQRTGQAPIRKDIDRKRSGKPDQILASLQSAKVSGKLVERVKRIPCPELKLICCCSASNCRRLAVISATPAIPIFPKMSSCCCDKATAPLPPPTASSSNGEDLSRLLLRSRP